MRYSIYLFVFIIGLFACTENKEQKTLTVDQQEPYFDIDKYMTEYLLHMDSARHVLKTITLNDTSEAINIEKYFIENDLNIFRTRNISKPKFRGKYDIIRTPIDTRYVRTDYKANDPKLKIRTFSIIRDHQNQLQSIQIIEMKNSAIAETNNLLVFTPQQGYRITLCDTMKALGKKCKTIEVRYIKYKK